MKYLLNLLLGLWMSNFFYSMSLKKSKQIDYAYPNFDQPATMSTQLPIYNFTVPPLSRALFEENPQKKLRRIEFVQIIKYALYNMSRGETFLLFDFADKNNDDLLTQEEWDDFATLYSYPFEACDLNRDWVLDPDEFKMCYEKDPKFKIIDYLKIYEPYKYKYIMRTVLHKGLFVMDFFGYTILKMATYAWSRCYSTRFYISKTDFRCAVGVMIPEKYQLQIDYDTMYRVGLELANNNGLIELDFLAYLRVMYYAYAFSVMGHPHDTPYIDKEIFIKAIREDRFPNNFDEKDVDYLYYLTDNQPYHPVTKMNFPTFAFFFHYLRVFNFYSRDRPKLMNITELVHLLGDPFVDKRIGLALDKSFANFTEKQYLEASLILQNLRINPRKNFFRFTQQDSSVETPVTIVTPGFNHTFFALYPQISDRSLLFWMMCEVNKRYWTREVYFRAFQLINMYIYMCEDIRWVISQPMLVLKMQTVYDLVNPQINLDQRRNYSMYKRLPAHLFLDLLTFLMLENFYWKLHLTNISPLTTITETNLKIVLKDYAMTRMPDSVLDVTRKGFDMMRRRIFDIYSTPVNVILVQAVCAELVRTKYETAYYGINYNLDSSRRYPTFSRRFMVSKHV